VQLLKQLEIAKQLATLNIMCCGKLVFGCGIGYRDIEFPAFGLTQKQAAAHFEERLLAVKRLSIDRTFVREASLSSLQRT
jgi:alkanesulfonate monooxygenase SsuD/methylene tetrahydromethanopterin reductase-like flavin-dependent oxidoreductase (luciferase family)